MTATKTREFMVEMKVLCKVHHASLQAMMSSSTFMNMLKRVCLRLIYMIHRTRSDHLLDDAGTAEKKIGIVRAQKESYLVKSLLDGNAQLALGSDWTVADIYPLRGIQTAIARVPPGRETTWIPSERAGLTDALKAFTISAAYASFLDHELGSLSPGKYADFVILDTKTWDEFAGQDVSNRIVEATYVNGVQAYP